VVIGRLLIDMRLCCSGRAGGLTCVLNGAHSVDYARMVVCILLVAGC
jgi:hypothetical protein